MVSVTCTWIKSWVIWFMGKNVISVKGKYGHEGMLVLCLWTIQKSLKWLIRWEIKSVMKNVERSKGDSTLSLFATLHHIGRLGFDPCSGQNLWPLDLCLLIISLRWLSQSGWIVVQILDLNYLLYSHLSIENQVTIRRNLQSNKLL